MNDPAGPKPRSGGCPTLETLRAFALGHLGGDDAIEVAAHLYLQRCSRCGDLLLAMPETTASALAPPPALTVHESPTDAAGLRTAAAPDGREIPTEPQPLRLGRYVIRHQLGKGGFSTVYAALDEELGRLVAVKVPHAHRLSRREQEQAREEARLHASLDHPNIVPIYDVGTSGNIPCYFVSKLIAGQDLAERIKESRPGYREAAALLLPLAEALAHLHGRGLIHRDVKPRNVLLDQAGTPYLADFGLAMPPLPEGAEEELLLAGTLAYMSPEQARGEAGRLDRRTDLYSLGVVLYEMLTGTRPFRGGVAALRHKILQEEPAAPHLLDPGVPRDLEAVCLKLLAKNPAQRYQDAEQVADDLRRFLAGEPPRYARHVGLAERALLWLRRRRALAAGVAVVAVLVAVLLALRKPGDRPLPEPAGGVPTAAVTVHTEPPGASVSYFPLDETTGAPQPAKVARAKAGETVEIARGHYLVVAVLGNRFHEVFRLVPGGKGGGMSGPFRHRRWKLIDGVLQLEPIKLAPADVAKDMRLFPGAVNYSANLGEPFLDKAGRLAFRERPLRIPAFYLDTTEVLTRDYHAWLLGEGAGRQPPKQPPDHPAGWVDWDRAVAYAEWLGKRLPDEAEYEYAATACGKARFPWGGARGPLKAGTWAFGRAGQPEQDRLALPGEPAVYGLYSNVAEWTSSWSGQHPERDLTFVPAQHRVVRGGPMSVVRGKVQLPDDVQGPRERFSLPITTEEPGLGFRCARSTRPRLEAKDFVADAGR